ncbi:MAG: SRPBCC family protein [Arenimonas sp.]
MSTDDFTANAAIAITASRKEVWDALITPSAIKQYMFGADVESTWHEGSDITWKGEFNGKRYEDKGVILKLETEKMLRYSHFSPLSGKPDEPDNYHVVTIMLADGADRTEVSLTQENNDDEQSRLESEKNWSAMLEGLKAYVEKS